MKKNFAGFGDWIESFMAGNNTDHSGQSKQWTTDDLDQIVQNFTEPVPVVIGHPEINSPAFGWVTNVKRAGDRLFSKINPTPALEGWVKDGYYKNRSVRLRKTDSGWKLDHIGFLGGVAPAIPNMPPVFNQLQEGYLDFNVEEAEMPQENSMKTEKKPTEQLPADFSAQMKVIIDEQMKQEREKNEQALAALKAQFQKKEDLQNYKDFSAFTQGLVKQGKVTPADAANMPDFMMALSKQSNVYEFSAADGTQQKLNPLDWFKNFAQKMPQQIPFGEMADGSLQPQTQNAQAIALKARDYVEAQALKGVTVSFTEAVELIKEEKK